MTSHSDPITASWIAGTGPQISDSSQLSLFQPLTPNSPNRRSCRKVESQIGAVSFLFIFSYFSPKRPNSPESSCHHEIRKERRRPLAASGEAMSTITTHVEQSLNRYQPILLAISDAHCSNLTSPGEEIVWVAHYMRNFATMRPPRWVATRRSLISRNL